ncbi:MAG: riboflavin biosynthesis protein RibF [Bacteroidales bacterium]|nr:riboflavin biosynthesis protein RibF [Bacteroidales bacterium]
MIILTFTKEFSQTTSIDFVRNILVNKLHARKIVIGFNHQFGFNREGNFEYLDELGKFYNFEVEEIPEQDLHNETVSSTLIRKALQDGRIQRANAYLDHLYFMMGKLLEGSAELKEKNMNTFMVQLDEECKLVPPDGVYAVRIESSTASSKGILNIKNSRYGNDRRFGDMEIEFFPFIAEGFTAGKDVTIYFAKRVRDELIFSDISNLEDQLRKDRILVEEMIY